jgi:hypothetical protein
LSSPGPGLALGDCVMAAPGDAKKMLDEVLVALKT